MKKPGCPPRVIAALVPVMALLFALPFLSAGQEALAMGPHREGIESAVGRGEAIFQTSCQACHSLKYSGYPAKMTAEGARKVFGKESPDLNLITKVRGGSKGTAYVAALLVGYDDTPEKNSVFPNIAMPPVFARNDPEAARKARDVSAFLARMADPSERERSSLGGYVVGYMAFLTALFYALDRRTWRRIRRRK